MNPKNFKLALVQMLVSTEPKNNLAKAKELILKASENGANVVVLPEYFISCCDTKDYESISEDVTTGDSTSFFKEVAKQAKVYIIGGSIIEKIEDKLYNTCVIFGPNGNVIDKHQKIYLYGEKGVNTKYLEESDVFTPGNKLTHIDTEYGKLGIAICYELRFPEYAKIASEQGCIAMIYPAVPDYYSAEKDWELLLRARAIDNQIYVAGCAPAYNPNPNYKSWGHSTIVDPAGQVISTSDDKETIVYSDIVPQKLNDIRKANPILKLTKNTPLKQYV
ncbi:carbon-nitrogen hydrolase [Neoconidiobolus thromboides FSU 785]|nr:carbon-nitrogen hydrolase [Neoconidiobolus thromboides FSU 785]